MIYIDSEGRPCVRQPGDIFMRYGRAFVAPQHPADMPSRWHMRAPLTPPIRPPRTIAVIEAEIRRAVVPGLRREDV